MRHPIPLLALLGDLLLQIGQPALALREYETALTENPNRYRGLYGAARAAEIIRDHDKATGYYEKLVTLASKADTPRREIARAKAFLGRP